jgi:excisionase family DNA binding protein
MPASSRRTIRPRRLARTAEAADYSGKCTRTLYRYIAQGLITGYRDGPKLILIDLDELDRLIQPIAAADVGRT